MKKIKLDLKKDEKVLNLWDELLEQELFTNEELQLITSINGLSLETLNDAMFARYGDRDYKQNLGYYFIPKKD